MSRWRFTGSKPVAVVVLVGMALYGLYAYGAVLRASVTIDRTNLDDAPDGRFANITCDRLDRIGTFSNSRRAYLCRLGDDALPVIGANTSEPSDSRRLISSPSGLIVASADSSSR